ncbi:MAG: hypothetical protein QNJ45_14965 [Ardenticatenaceae bacterium]|nr:hypothetical protein [Ardenticatenaceae bacterium]
MATPSKRRLYTVKGQVDLAEVRGVPDDLELMAYAFDRAGRPLGETKVNAKGNYNLKVALTRAADIDLVIAPAADAKTIRKAAVHSERITAEQLAEGVFEADIFVPDYIWHPWRPVRICISGHVRKLTAAGTCPVPFTKVEIFDVDREPCFWPLLVAEIDKIRPRKVVEIPELLKEPLPRLEKIPDPGPPDPGPYRARFRDVMVGPETLTRFENPAALGPQPEPPDMVIGRPASVAAISPQPEPPRIMNKVGYVGEMAEAAPETMEALKDVTLTAKLPPWIYYPLCFYSKTEVCETNTDECGYFRCCFKWWPFHFRRGRLRYDHRPDIILKVTQVIDGVETIIYLDPYSSTRWNVTHAHIDLFLDDERILCGTCQDDYDRPEGTHTFFTRIGNDEVFHINQTTGLYSDTVSSQVAYGHVLRVHAQFGDTLSRHQAIPGATAPYYYKLSYSDDGTNFTPITAVLTDTRVNKTTLFSETHKLGPFTVNGVPSLYEIRDFGGYYWYNPDWIARWNTLFENDTDRYTLRLEVFDSTGTKLDSTKIDYLDGTVSPGNVLPPMSNRCDLKITIDNKRPVVNLTVIGFEDTLNNCGVIKWTPTLTLNFQMAASQENNRLRRWGLYYTKGFGGANINLLSGFHATGTPGSVSHVVSGAPLLAGLTSSCAFGLKVWARAHIRNGYHYIYYREDIQALTIEKCP